MGSKSALSKHDWSLIHWSPVRQDLFIIRKDSTILRDKVQDSNLPLSSLWFGSLWASKIGKKQIINRPADYCSNFLIWWEIGNHWFHHHFGYVCFFENWNWFYLGSKSALSKHDWSLINWSPVRQDLFIIRKDSTILRDKVQDSNLPLSSLWFGSLWASKIGKKQIINRPADYCSNFLIWWEIGNHWFHHHFGYVCFFENWNWFVNIFTSQDRDDDIMCCLGIK